LNDADLAARTEEIIAVEETKANAALEPWRVRLKGKRVLLYTGGVKSWSIVSALQDLGMTVVATGTKKSTEEEKARIREIMGPDVNMIDDGMVDLAKQLALTIESPVWAALKKPAPWATSQPVGLSLAG